MASAKHTPGPAAYYVEGQWRILILSSGEWKICTWTDGKPVQFATYEDAFSRMTEWLDTEIPDKYRIVTQKEIAAPDLLASLRALKLVCLADPLNPCWDNRPDDVPGLHWGSSANETFPACTSCNARAGIAKATGAA